MTQTLPHRWDHIPLYRWWRRSIVGSVDQEQVMERILAESGWSPRYLFMIMMSAGIAVLGLLLSSPAVVIGAMLISPLMSPILGLGFSLAMFDFTEMRRSVIALALGAGVALLFTALIVTVSPLKTATAEILARTRPNLFDLLVALFAALAGTFAIIRGRGETIVGVAIATALMPPIAVVGYGLATGNLPILGGALALFVTNFVTIALAAMIMARFYGFGHHLSSQQSWTQTIILTLVFVVMAIPLGISLSRIAGEAVTTAKARAYLVNSFGSSARVTQLDMDFDRHPLVVRTVIIAPRSRAVSDAKLQAGLSQRLGRKVTLQVDQVLLDPGAGAAGAQRAELHQASDDAEAETALSRSIATLVGLAAGVAPDSVTVDGGHHSATATAVALPGADLATYAALEQRAAAAQPGWDVAIVPPLTAMPVITFAKNADALDPDARRNVDLSIWAARRWNSPALAIPGLPADGTAHPALLQRRALSVAAVLKDAGISVVSAPASRQSLRLAPAQTGR